MISELEKRILNSLSQNARKSLREVAKESGVSVTAIYNNVKKLEKKGVIKGYIPVIDLEKIGLYLTTIIALRVDQPRDPEFEPKLYEFEQVSAIFKVTGEWDYILLCHFRGLKDLDNFIINQLAMPEVERTISHIVLSVIKDEKRIHIL